ncbi:MAG: hypothetical protein WCI97_13270 [Bacteroidota bacterium]
MKRHFLKATMILISLFFLVSFTNDNRRLIVRKWHFSELQSPALTRIMNENNAKISSLVDSIKASGSDTAHSLSFRDQKEMLESQMNMMTSMLAKMKSEGWIEFTKRGKYKQNMSGTEDEGTYALDADGKKLMTTDSKGKTDTLNIDELSNDAMTLSTPKDSTKIMFTAEAGEKK